MASGNQVVQHLGLILQRCQVGGAGNVAAGGAVEVLDAQRHAVLGDGGAQNGNVGGGSHGSLEGGGGVGHNQVNALGDKAVGNGGAGVGIAGSVL